MQPAPYWRRRCQSAAMALLGTAIAVASLHCGSDASDEVFKDAYALAETPEAWAQAYCDWLLRCCDGPESTSFVSLDDCVEQTQEMKEPWVDLAEAIEGGEVVFDPELAAACVAETRDYPCDGEAHEKPACAELFEPLRTVGESCVHHWSCDSYVCRDGTCAPRAQLGDECDETEGGKGWLCEDELYCNNKGICVEWGQEGDRCDEDEEELPCDDDLLCQEDGTCGDYNRPEGARCADSFCAGGLICVCGSYNCAMDEGVCTPFGERGDHCGENGPFCGTGLRCDDGECVPGKRAGEACEDSVNGEKCGRDDDGHPQYCLGSDDDAVCVPQARAGEPCNDEEGPYCLEGFCKEGRCSEKQCHLYE